MFETTEVYMGTMIANDTQNLSDGQPAPAERSQANSPEDILQYAREEAAEILENAHFQADEILALRREEADNEANQIITNKVNQTFTALGDDLWSAQTGITQIVEQSINLMIGAVGSEKAFAFCVNKATQDYLSANNLKVHAHPDSANRLRLYNIQNQKTKPSANYEIIDDTSLEPGRCILDTGEKRIEVSLDVQIKALKRSLENSLVQGQK